MNEHFQLALIVLGVSVSVTLLGGIVLRLLRNQRLFFQCIAVSVLTTAAIGLSLLVAANQMFISNHDFGVLLFILIIAAIFSIGMSVLLARWIQRATQELQRQTRELQPGDDVAITPAPAEFRRLAKDLEHMSYRLDEARARERSLEASRRELFAWISHDLRRPLAGIRAMAEALEDGMVDEEETAQRYYQTIRQQTEQLATLVGDLFELSRIDANVLDLTRDVVSVRELLSEVIAITSIAAQHKDIALETADVTDAQLYVSSREIVRVLHNVLDNAVRHTDSGGVITIRCICSDGFVRIAVRDSCGGIPAEDLDRVFDLAFRGDSARTKPGGGLGLAIARGLVEAHNGTIVANNVPGGCEFVVSLPTMQRLTSEHTDEVLTRSRND